MFRRAIVSSFAVREQKLVLDWEKFSNELRKLLLSRWIYSRLQARMSKVSNMLETSIDIHKRRDYLQNWQSRELTLQFQDYRLSCRTNPLSFSKSMGKIRLKFNMSKLPFTISSIPFHVVNSPKSKSILVYMEFSSVKRALAYNLSKINSKRH